jgi:8-oxo-dGTP pyrophosphatase MutT (NUDIX family)
VGYLRHIESCNRWTPADYRPFRLAGRPVGLVRRDVMRRIESWRDLVAGEADGLALLAEPDDFATRSRTLSALTDRMIESALVPRRRGVEFAVAMRFADPPLAAIDRGALVALGVRAYGVHVNGLVRTGSGIELWIGRRARDKEVAPGQLDNLVAGGQQIGLTPLENVRKEAREEAGIAPELASRAVPAGALSYTMALPDGLRRDTLFVYDLELSESFEPRNDDGEFEGFRRLPLAEVARRVRDTDDFKFNVNLVIIDFLIRHGVLTPDEPDYLELVQGLHR